MGKTGKLVASLIALSCVFATEPAIADCDEGAVVDGRTPVICTGPISVAYEPSVFETDDIDLTVNSGVTVSEEAGGSQAILLNDDSTIVNNGSVTATVDGQNAILIGNNGSIENNGTITGGPDDGMDLIGSAIVFTGTDASAVNRVDNKSGGVITTESGVAIEGSAGTEAITLRDGSTTIGDLVLGAGADVVTIESGATLTGEILLGNGDNFLTLEDGAEYTTVIGLSLGDGNDTVVLKGSSGGGSTFNGNINLGNSDTPTDANERNSLTLEIGSSLNGSVMGGDNDDLVTIKSGATLNGNVDLGAGGDVLRLKDGASYTGEVRAGAGEDRVILEGALDGGSTLIGDVYLGVKDNLDLGAGEKDVLRLQRGSFLDGDVFGGAGDDLVEIATDAEIVGDIDLGEGTNTFTTFDGATLTGNFVGGDDSDTVTLNSDVVVTGKIELGGGDDTLDYGSQVSVSGIMDLGSGDDTLILRPRAVLPLPADLILGNETDIDTLQLANPREVDGFNFGTVDLSDNDEFKRLVVGEADSATAVGWQISTTSQVHFQSGVLVHPLARLLLDGRVEIMSGADFTQSLDTVLQFALGQSIDDSFLDLTGTLTIEPVVPSDPDNLVTTVVVTYDGNIVAGDYTLIKATDGITGEFDVEDFPTSSIFDFSAEFTTDGGSGNIYLLTVEQIAFYNDFAESSNETEVGVYLEAARAGAAVTSFGDIITQLDAISDPSELSTALAQLNPGSFDAHTSGILSWGRVQQRELQQRPMRCERFQFAPMPDVVTDNPCGAGGVMPWTKVVGSLGKNKGGGEPGYDSLVGGAIIGVDYRWNESLWFSGSMGYGTGEIEYDVGADGSFKSVDVGVAAGTVHGSLSVRGSFTYSHGFHDITRNIDFLGARLESQFDSDRVGLALGVGYRMKLGPIVIEPNAAIDYSHVEEEAVKEEGDAEVALNLDARTTDLFSATAGVQFSTNILKYRYFGDMLEWADGLWIPSVSFKWRQAFGDLDRNATARMQGVPAASDKFDSKSSDASGGAEIGAHLSFQPMKSGNTIELGYDGFFGGDVTSHSANVTVRIPF